jgi:drug/metabolite transporter (DMT)-like permease
VTPRNRATFIGFLAILSWAVLAALTAWAAPLPPFQLTAMAFGVSGVIAVIRWALRPSRMAVLRQPARVWALGVGGLFGYHFLYFTALQAAPPVEASLIAYLWPLLIVLFSALLPGERLGAHHLAGAAMGFAGAALIVTGGQGISLRTEYTSGYAIALLAAVTWSGYSLLSRRVAHVPTEIVSGFCLAAAVLATLCHLWLETTIWPARPAQWLAILVLGLGPVGLAFFAWDHGVKRGDIQILGVASYAAPLLSTLVLIAVGLAQPGWTVAVACILITAGALVASRDMLPIRRR